MKTRIAYLTIALCLCLLLFALVHKDINNLYVNLIQLCINVVVVMRGGVEVRNDVNVV